MHIHTANVRWTCRGDFAKGRYSRVHEWEFDGGAVVQASASPANVPGPWSDEGAVDPEEAFVAAISSCHMLWFLDIARREGFTVVTYFDDAEGRMGRGPDPSIERVDLYPRVEWRGTAPDAETIVALHRQAHGRCFIANSVKTEIVVNS